MFDDLFLVTGSDAGATASISAIVEDLASKPEVNALLHKAKARHKKPLRFIVGASPYEEAAMYTAEENTVYFDPERAKTAMHQGEHGEDIKLTPEIALTHEMYHAADEDHQEQTGQYRARIHAIQEHLIPAIDWEAYKNRFDAVRSDRKKLEALLTEIYDTQIAPVITNCSEKLLDAARRDPFITEYLRKYEEPAIRFSNEIVSRHYNQPTQATDYLSTIKTESMSREDFIGGLSEQFYQPPQPIEEQALSRSGKRTEPSPREGSWAEN